MFTAQNPHELTCVFQRPERLFHYQLSGVEMMPDGRVYTATWKQDRRGKWTIEMREGEHEGLMRLRLQFERSNDNWVGPGSLTLFHPGSGLQFAAENTYLGVAPYDGYAPSQVIEIPDIDTQVGNSLYFHGPDRYFYGAIDVRVFSSVNYSTPEVRTPSVDLRFWINDSRGRAVLSHLAEDK